MNKPLDRALAEQMVNAIHTINSIANDESDESTKLRAFLATSFVEHASEFLGAWFTLSSEYAPLVAIFAALQRRATALNKLPEGVV